MAGPRRIPLLRTGLIILAIFGFAWISLEGDPRWSLIMAFTALLVGSAYLIKRLIIGRTISRYVWIFLLASCGLALGLLFAPTTLIFMAIKTGLHGHGAEFTRAEIEWLFDRIALWAAAGLLAGAGLGLLITGFQRSREAKGI